MARTGTFDPQIQALAWVDTQAFAEGWFADDLIPPAVTGVTAALAASETGADVLAADAFIGYKVLAAMAASEAGPDIFAASAIIGTPPPPAAVDIYLIKLRSFTEHRRF
jgi:hypothetical protein